MIVMSFLSKCFKFKTCLFLWIIFLVNSVFAQSELAFGDLVLIKNIKTGKFLCSGEKSFNNGEFDGIEDGDRRHKLVWLSSKTDYESIWILKGAHSDDLRWNATLGQKLKQSEKFRLESLDSHCNFSTMRNSKNVVCLKRISLPLGIGADEDNLKFSPLKKDSEDQSGEPSVKDNSEFNLIFSDTGDFEVVLFYDEKDNLLKVKTEKELSEEEKDAGIWVFELMQKNFAAKDDGDLEAQIKNLKARDEWSEVNGSTVSTLSLWQDEAESNFLISAIDLADGYAYLSNLDNLDAIKEKLPDRFASIFAQSDQSLLCVEKTKKIKKMDLKDLSVEKTTEISGKAELCFSGKEDELFRLESVGWDLFKAETVKPEFVWQKEPILKNVVYASAGVDGTLWWVDLDGNIFKKLGDKVQQIFNHTVFSNPKFVKLSVSGSWETNYLAILRSDGTVFLSKNNGAFFSPGLNHILDVSIGRAGRVAIAARRYNWVNGPIFKSKFAALEKWYSENNRTKIHTFQSPETFLDYYSYNFELIKRGSMALSDFIVDFQASSEPMVKELKNHDATKVFFNERVKPALKEIELTKFAKLALSRVESELFVDAGAVETPDFAALTEKNLKLSATLESEKTAAKIALDAEIDKRVALENKLDLIQQEFEAVLFRLDELEHENKDLRQQLENSKKVEPVEVTQSPTQKEEPKETKKAEDQPKTDGNQEISKDSVDKK